MGKDVIMQGVLKLIERQTAMQEIQRRMDSVGERPGRFQENGVSYGPCLLISRECGSGGHSVSQIVAERLGWQLVDREIVDQISELAHTRQRLVESVDERVRSNWESTWRPMLDPEDIGCETYLRYLREVVLTFGHTGDVIILGRGAHHLLPARSALRVRLVAPLEDRAARLAEIKGFPLPRAKEWVRQLDAERAAFIQRNFHQDAAAPLNYDLIINTGQIGFNEAADVILTGLARKLGVTVAEPLLLSQV